jgi:hypothetical protein
MSYNAFWKKFRHCSTHHEIRKVLEAEGINFVGNEYITEHHVFVVANIWATSTPETFPARMQTLYNYNVFYEPADDVWPTNDIELIDPVDISDLALPIIEYFNRQKHLERYAPAKVLPLPIYWEICKWL